MPNLTHQRTPNRTAGYKVLKFAVFRLSHPTLKLTRRGAERWQLIGRHVTGFAPDWLALYICRDLTSRFLMR